MTYTVSSGTLNSTIPYLMVKMRRHATVKRWAAEFRRGGTSLEDDPRSGRPSDAVCEENCHVVENIVMQNRRVNVHQIADTVGISTGSVKTILHEHLFMTKMCTMGPQNAHLCHKQVFVQDRLN